MNQIKLLKIQLTINIIAIIFCGVQVIFRHNISFILLTLINAYFARNAIESLNKMVKDTSTK